MAIDRLEYTFLANEILRHEKMQGLGDKVDELVDAANAVDRRLEYANFGGGIVYAEKYGTDFETALNAAIAASVSEGRAWTTIDCTYFTGSWTFQNAIVLAYPVTILLGNCEITSYGVNVFDVRSNNVRIFGANRETDRTVLTANATIIRCMYVSNESNEGYHIYSRGNKNCQYKNMYLIGQRTTLGRQCGNASYPINGSGGIYIEKGNPGTVSAGNTVNATIIENVLIDGSKAHGIYIDTPILSFIRNCRLSNIAGHGVFVSGGTTMTLEGVYVASARLAGFCLYQITYCTVLNSVAEYCGIAWWIRSCNNVSIFSPGVEHTINNGRSPWSGAYGVSGVYGFNVRTTTEGGVTVRVNDVPNDSIALRGQNVALSRMFIGVGFLVTGGRNIDIYSPYVQGIGFDADGGADNIYEDLRYFIVTGNARSVRVMNVGFKGGAGGEESHASAVGSTIPYELEIGGLVDGCDVTFNPKNTTLSGVSQDAPVTADITARDQILNLSGNALIRYGNIYYTAVNYNGGLNIAGNFTVGGILTVEGLLTANGGIRYRGTIEHDTSGMTYGVTAVYSPAGSSIAWSDSGVDIVVTLGASLTEGSTVEDVTADSTFQVYVNDVLYATVAGSVGTATIHLSVAGAYRLKVVGSYSSGSDSYSDETAEHSVTYEARQAVQPTFVSGELTDSQETEFTCRFLVLSDFVITSGGAAYSYTNTQPTTAQNDAPATSIAVDSGYVGDSTRYVVTVTVPRSAADRTRYVRFYFATNDAEAATTEKVYSGTYAVTGNVMEAYT